MPILTLCKTIEVNRVLLSAAWVWIAFIPCYVFDMAWLCFTSMVWMHVVLSRARAAALLWFGVEESVVTLRKDIEVDRVNPCPF